MKRTTLFAALALTTLQVSAQNSWDGSSPAISTVTTNGKVAIGTATPDPNYLLTLKNTNNTISSGFLLNINNTKTGNQYGAAIGSWFNATGNGNKYGLSNSVVANTSDEVFGICNVVQTGPANGTKYGIASTVATSSLGALKCALYGNVIDGNLFGIGTKPNAHRAGFFVGATEIIASTDNEKAFIINRRNIGAVNVGTDVFRIYGDGKVFATEINVKLATQFPDYVFESDYKLMPLTEVRNYITTNKHLPNMPTAETVANEGMNLGEMNKVVVEKLEELTLYILQQQAEIDQLKKELESIKH